MPALAFFCTDVSAAGIFFSPFFWELSADVGIPTKLEAIKEEDLQFLAESAHADACAPGNPKDASVEDLNRKLKDHLHWSNRKPMRTLGGKSPLDLLREKLSIA